MFTGRELDTETGLYYYRARYYDPKLGRFLQRDPVGYTAGINLYTYCSNNPVNFTDPRGLNKEKPWWLSWWAWSLYGIAIPFIPTDTGQLWEHNAPFEWWDITSWIFPGTNYCGWTKSGPGPCTSNVDCACENHDQSLKNSNTSWWDITNKDVIKAHEELIKSWLDPGKTNNKIVR